MAGAMLSMLVASLMQSWNGEWHSDIWWKGCMR